MLKTSPLWVALALIIPASSVLAARIMLTLLTPTASTSRVTIAAAGAGIRNCITDLDVVDDAAYTFRVIDGATPGTTIYAVTLSSGSTIVRSWSRDTPLCGGTNAVLELYANTGNFNINYSGFTGQ